MIEHCGLGEEWRQRSHKLGGFLSSPRFREHQKAIDVLVGDWEDSIRRFAPSAIDDWKKFRTALNNSLAPKDFGKLKESLQRLDERLCGILTPLASVAKTAEQFSRRPPKGFTRILIADDEPQNFLGNSLRDQYGYDVVPQGFKLSQARELLTKEKPDVVLSDLFFKESTRMSEIPDKSVGDRFIQSALTHKQYANSNPRKPIVLVTSKAMLRTETDIRAGAINCSGGNRATNPAFIHHLIWAEARRRGVVEQENPVANNWTVEQSWSNRLRQCETDLPRLIVKWQKFPETVAETVRLCRLFAMSGANDDPNFVARVIDVLDPYKFVASFSLETAESIFKDTERIRITAQESPNSNSKSQVLSILHGKVEQCALLTSAVNSMIEVFGQVADQMVAISKFGYLASRLQAMRADFAKSKPLLPQLIWQKKILESLLLRVPASPQLISQRRPAETAKVCTVNLVVVEDDEFWRDFVSAAIEKVKVRLGQGFEIRAQYFDNPEDALQVIPHSSRTFAIAQSHAIATQTVVIADLCLPENRANADNIRAFSTEPSAAFCAPHSKHGLNLIRKLSTYEFDVPLIVLSTVHAIGDRGLVGSLGVADQDFLAKGIDDEDSLMRALIRKIETKPKFIVKRIQDKDGVSRFTLNGITILLSRELGRTLFALIDLHQTRAEDSFTVTQIVEARGDSQSTQSRKSIHDHVLRLRKVIFKMLQRNGVYVNVRELLRTEKSPRGDSFRYRLNAEIVCLEDESDYECDLREYQRDRCRVLIIENDLQLQGTISTTLTQLKYEIAVAGTAEEAVRAAIEFAPHIVSLNLEIPYTRIKLGAMNFNEDGLAGIEAWEQIRLALRTSSLGIVVASVNLEKDNLVAQAAQMEIPIRNFVSKRQPNWLNLFLKKIADEKQRVYLGEITDVSLDLSEPIIQILNGSDLLNGILRLSVNGQLFTMKVSPIARIIGLLVSNPNRLLSLNEIKRVSGIRGGLTKDDSKNWTKRIRSTIQEKWLSGHEESNGKNFTRKILESSSRGFQLNAQVIDLRTSATENNPSS
ncbi:MAG TPA: hypothetical protein VLL54_12875 [Pyrinomonadaceae bacterium]|nr:hypothetical protein [Pyrinomonadaceae bacterium]